MSKLNLLVFLNSYSDKSSSNNPTLSNFKWARSVDGLTGNNPLSMSFSLAPGETRTLFTGGNTKKFIYLESDLLVNLTINGVTGNQIKPFVINNTTQPGVFLRTSDITSLTVINPSGSDAANLFLAAVE